MTPQLTIVPIGGLCNRFRVALSAFHLAPELPLPIRVEWGSDSDCHAFFDELFLPLEGRNFALGRRRFLNAYSTRCNLKLPGLLRMPFYDLQNEGFNPLKEGSLQHLVRQRQRVYIATGYALCDYPTRLINLLQPVPDIADSIKGITDSFHGPTVGVHIRRTDHKQAIAHSSDEAFIKAMEQEIEQKQDVRFYLATDDPILKKRLTERFGKRIIQQDTPCNRNSLSGIRGAVVDLYALASTQKILGSYYSSFSGTAAEFRDIPLHTIGEEM